jgi:hypothetical protein
MNHLIIAPLYFFLGVFFSVCFLDKRSREIISELKEENKLASIECESLRGRLSMFEKETDRYRNEVINLRLKIHKLEEKQKCPE